MSKGFGQMRNFEEVPLSIDSQRAELLSVERGLTKSSRIAAPSSIRSCSPNVKQSKQLHSQNESVVCLIRILKTCCLAWDFHLACLVLLIQPTMFCWWPIDVVLASDTVYSFCLWL